MASLERLAYPYVHAIFSFAEANGTTDKWLTDLASLAMVAADPDFRELITNPRITSDELLKFLLGFVTNPQPELANLLILLSTNSRLQVLPELYQLYQHKVEESKNQVTATIQSAFPVKDVELAQIVELLTKRVGKKVSATVEIVPELIGGIKILMNDMVMDASVKGGLEKLGANLSI